jgi:hypothetical protein
VEIAPFSGNVTCHDRQLNDLASWHALIKRTYGVQRQLSLLARNVIQRATVVRDEIAAKRRLPRRRIQGLLQSIQ